MPEQFDKWSFKRVLKERRLYAYEVAEELHITESALSKQLRSPSKEQLAKIIRAVEKLSGKAV